MVEKVTREERMVTLMKQAAEKAIEILNANDFNEDDLTGEDVKVKKPKAEKVSDAKGGDEQADNRTRDAVGSDGNQVMKKIIKSIPIEKCDVYESGCKNDAAMFSTINCGKLCQTCYDEMKKRNPRFAIGWKPFTVEEFRQKCMFE